MESNTLKFVMLKEEPDPNFPRTWLLSAYCNQVHEAGIGIDLSRIIRLHTYTHTHTHTHTQSEKYALTSVLLQKDHPASEITQWRMTLHAFTHEGVPKS